MHVAWTALLDPPESRPRLTLRALRRHIAGRLHLVPRFRQRLAPTPLDLAEPCWEDDPDFELVEHVVSLSSQADRMPADRFRALTDAVLSEPLDRARPLWRLYVVPRLEDGRIGLVAKMHHAMVDGGRPSRSPCCCSTLSRQRSRPPRRDWSPRPGGGNGATDRGGGSRRSGGVATARCAQGRGWRGHRSARARVWAGRCGGRRWRWRRTSFVRRRPRSSTAGSVPSARSSATAPHSSRSWPSRRAPG